MSTHSSTYALCVRSTKWKDTAELDLATDRHVDQCVRIRIEDGYGEAEIHLTPAMADRVAAAISAAATTVRDTPNHDPDWAGEVVTEERW